ncbi:MAG: heavy metal translocating P-type ATPase [Candidatus Thorarchaeota archaeon]
MGETIFKYELKGLTCTDCALKIEQSLKNHNYQQVCVNFATNTLYLSSDDLETINKIISKVDPETKAISASTMGSVTKKWFRENLPLVQALLASILLLIGMVLITSSLPSDIILLGYISLLVAYGVAGWKVLWNAVKRIRNLDLTNEYFLMSIATLGAILIQEVPEAVAVMVFYTIGESLQMRAVNRSRRSISALIDIRPDQAHLLLDDSVKTVPAEEINAGDIILVKPGERVPLDGVVIKGEANLDLSALTGESRPVRVSPGMEVLSGAIPNNSICIRVTSVFNNSTVSRILNAIENATNKRSNTERFITRFSRIYTPIILGFAILVGLFPPLLLQEPLNEWIYRALVILVISCPCALVVSVPLAYFSGIGKSSREGILFKGANVLDELGKINTVLWDKTGTLTVGKFSVVTVVPRKGVPPDEVLKIAAIAEAHSTHPIAVSIREAYGKPTDLSRIEQYEELPALGIRCRVDNGGFNDEIMVGNDRLVHSIECPHPNCVKDQTAVYVIKNNEYMGHIIVDDRIRESSKKAIARLNDFSIQTIGLLTGDTKDIGERVGHELGIQSDSIYTNLMPLNKLEILEAHMNDGSENKRRYVIFVGDGINDAPVIAGADVGVAMGGIGSDATIEAADLVIMDDNPEKLGIAMEIAKKTRKIAKQNIGLAIGLKVVFILLGAMGIATMWAAVFGDVGVTILTILNSLRILD